MKEILEKYLEKGLVYNQIHPTLPLTIWNYSEKVQFERLWDDVLVQVRGLVIDNNGNVIARPFKKFFNLDENRHTPTDEFEVFEKMDGSCIICFYYNDEWICATRGSFISEQAIMANKLLQKYPIEKLDKNSTYIFEIIY